MEDSHSFVVDFDDIRGQGYFGLFDGHAGKHAAEWCGQHFHEVRLHFSCLRNARAYPIWPRPVDRGAKPQSGAKSLKNVSSSSISSNLSIVIQNRKSPVSSINHSMPSMANCRKWPLSKRLIRVVQPSSPLYVSKTIVVHNPFCKAVQPQVPN